MTITPIRDSHELITKCRRNSGRPLAMRQDVKTATGTKMTELRGQVIGYGSFYSVSDPWGSFQERIHPDACRDALASPNLDVAFLVGHNSAAVPLARTGAAASLDLHETRAGLQVRALVDKRMQGAAELIYGLQNGTIGQLSIGMSVDQDKWSGSDAHGNPDIRDIYKLTPSDVSAVAWPANPDTALELANAALRAFRAAPTAADPHITKAIAHAHAATAAALAAQSSDPDFNADPDDNAVWKALAAQGIDGNADGTQGTSGGDDPGIGNQDGTGRAARLRMIEDDTDRIHEAEIDIIRARYGIPKKPNARQVQIAAALRQIEDDKRHFADMRIRHIRDRADIDAARRLAGLPPR